MLASGEKKKKYLEEKKGQSYNTLLDENFSLIFQFPDENGWPMLEQWRRKRH